MHICIFESSKVEVSYVGDLAYTSLAYGNYRYYYQSLNIEGFSCRVSFVRIGSLVAVGVRPGAFKEALDVFANKLLLKASF